jgi:hypothetical protein
MWQQTALSIHAAILLTVNQGPPQDDFSRGPAKNAIDISKLLLAQASVAPEPLALAQHCKSQLHHP